MKFLYIQDTHLRGKSPENRVGNYYNDIMTKIKEVIYIAKEFKVKAILHGGDLYDSDLVSNIMSDEFMDLVEDSGIEWYILPGNHDETGNNWKLSKATSLAHMFRRCKLINWLTKEKFKDLIVYGYEYYHNIEGYIRENGLFCEDKTDKLKIAIVHALIVQKPLPYECMHVVAKDIKTDFDVVLVAHNHQQWSIKEINGTKFIDIGCLGRRKIDEKNINPMCLVIDTSTKESSLIELKSAKPAKEVFDLKKVEEIKQFEGEINNFISSLSDVKIQGLNIRGMIEFIGKEKNVEQEIIKEVVKRIGGFER